MSQVIANRGFYDIGPNRVLLMKRAPNAGRGHLAIRPQSYYGEVLRGILTRLFSANKRNLSHKLMEYGASK